MSRNQPQNKIYDLIRNNRRVDSVEKLAEAAKISGKEAKKFLTDFPYLRVAMNKNKTENGAGKMGLALMDMKPTSGSFQNTAL